MVLICVALCLLIHPYLTTSVTQSPCGTDNTLELVENTASNQVTCTGFMASDVATWRLLTQGNKDNQIAICAAPPDSSDPETCINGIKPPFTASRTVSDRTSLTVDTTDEATYGIVFKGTTLVCRTNTQTNDQSDQCRMDLVAIPGNRRCDVCYNAGTASSWTLTANCTVSGAYSFLNRYNCQLVQTSPNSSDLGSAVDMVVTPTGKYKTGTCDVTVPFPDTSATYSYKMVVTPGRVDVPAGFGTGSSLQIRRPSSPPTHTCDQYVEETQGLSCTCSTTDLGQPAGVIRWTRSGTGQLSLSNVNKNQDGQRYRCEVKWNGQRVQSVVYTLRVAYGPTSATIASPDLPYDTNGSQEMTLTCSGSDVNPSPSFTWPRLPSSNVVVQGNTVKFTPQPPGDDNSVFECRVENTVTGTTRSASVTVSLNYPPTTDPVITITSTPSSSNGHLYQGDRVTLTCTVTGGKPLSATTLTFTCPGKQDVQDTEGSTGVSSSVTIESLTNGDHDIVCTCSSKWKQTDWYNRHTTTQLFVNTPPSSPVISPPSTDYPFIATVTRGATLTCLSPTPGRPAATYSWPIKRGGRGGTDGQGRGVLTFDTVSRELDGRSVSCRAKNRYTANRQRVEDGTLTLEVYYHPEVRLDPVTGTNPNQCDPMTSNPSRCVVTEGQRVHFRCVASSKPAPASVTWQGRGDGPDLYIESTSRNQHTDTYNCSVETGPGNHGNDTRLPLRGWAAVTVIVKSPAYSVQLTLNSRTGMLTVYENQSTSVVFLCEAYGVPLPDLLLSDNHDREVARLKGGNGDGSVQQSRLTHTLSSARCEDSAVYTCTAENGLGTAVSSSATLRVLSLSNATTTATTSGSVAVSTESIRHDITCGHTEMSFSIPVPSELSLPQTVTLSDSRCRVDTGGNHLTGRTFLNDCGTTVSFTNDTIIFSNAIYLSFADNASSVNRVIPLECHYERVSELHLSYLSIVRRVLFTETGVGQFGFRIEQFKDDSFSAAARVADSAYPLRTTPSEAIFVQLSLEDADLGHGRFGMVVEGCVASPSSSVVAASNGTYEKLIEGGCPASSDVYLIRNHNATRHDNLSRHFRFSFKAVTFPDSQGRASAGLVYIHCRVRLCPPHACPPRSRACPLPASFHVRERRAVSESGDRVVGHHQLSTGPLLVVGDSGESAAVSSSSSVPLIVLGAIAASATLLAAAVLVAWRLRARQSEGQRQLKVTTGLE